MRKRVKLLVSASAIAIAIGAIFCSWKLQSTSAQASYQLNVWCEDSGPAAASFWYDDEASRSVGLTGLCAGKCKGRTVSLDEALAGLPAKVSAGLRAQVAKHEEDAAAGIGQSIAKCVGMGNAKPEKSCEKSPPWFDGSSDCPDVQRPVVAVTGNAVTVSICGSSIFRFPLKRSLWPDEIEAQRMYVRKWMYDRVGNSICCNKFREASRTGTPCDPRSDIDCDGKSNQTDGDINPLYSKAQGARLDPFPAGFDANDPDFRPERTARNSKGVGECSCNWELIKGELKCSPDRRQRHVYTATWRCPSTKAEVFTTKYASATAPCP